MASLEAPMRVSRSVHLLANLRRFFRWLTSPHVILSLIMLVVLYYMVVIPLYRMVLTTLTWQPRDILDNPGAVVGGFTLFHYVRMVSGALGKIYLYTPLGHSFTVSIGATLLSLLIGGSLAWLVIRTDMPGRKVVNQLALIPYIMPSWTLAQAWLVFFKSTSFSGGTPGLYQYLVGQAPPTWLSYGPVPIIICSALHYYTFFFLFVSAALMSIDSSLEEAGDGDPLGFYHDLFQGAGDIRRTQYPGDAGQVLCCCHHDPRQYGRGR
jgi:iron(III) transport system permease protein